MPLTNLTPLLASIGPILVDNDSFIKNISNYEEEKRLFIKNMEYSNFIVKFFTGEENINFIILKKYSALITDNNDYIKKYTSSINGIICVQLSHIYFCGKSVFSTIFLPNENIFLHEIMQHEFLEYTENEIKKQEITESKFSEINFMNSKTEEFTDGRKMQTRARYLQKNASSLYGGQAFFKKRQQIIKNKKKTKKDLLIEENIKRREQEELQKNILFLKNFYIQYKKMNTEQKKEAILNIEKNNINNFIIKEILLLKMELLVEDWNLEKLKDEIDEKVVLPIYLTAIKFFNLIGKGENIKKVTYVVEKCREANLHGIAEELFLNFKEENKEKMKIIEADLYFQFNFAGDNILRSDVKLTDNRVLFNPDPWQIELLDIVDNYESRILIAPTSSGKTFICFYAIERVLDDFYNKKKGGGRILFCLPTKALINQVTADIYARFGTYNTKKTKHGVLLADHNYNIDSHVLLCTPDMTDSIALDFDYIIIDEVHRMNSKEGSALERILNRATAPKLLLSATIGNKDEFSKHFNIEKLEVFTRYCDLYYYHYNKQFNEIHLFNNLIDKIYYMDLPPKQVYKLYLALYNVFMDKYKAKQISKTVFKTIQMKKYFTSNILNRSTVREYEKYLVDIINKYCTVDEKKKIILLCTKSTEYFNSDKKDCINIIDYLMKLKKNVPLICFAFNRDICNKIGMEMNSYLKQFDEREKTKKNINKMPKKEIKNKLNKLFEETMALEENITVDNSISDNNSFTDSLNRLSKSEFDEYIYKFKNRIHPIFIEMLRRGIGVHHNGVNKHYRSAVEILFRNKHIQLIIATETLSLGIHMPCKSVVLYKDSELLTPSLFKQVIGRSGRRGFDLSGSIYFYDFSYKRIRDLMGCTSENIIGDESHSISSICRMVDMCSEDKSKNILLNRSAQPDIFKNFINFPFNSFKSENQLKNEKYFNLENKRTKLTDLLLAVPTEESTGVLLLIDILIYEKINIETILPEKLILLLCNILYVEPLIDKTDNILNDSDYKQILLSYTASKKFNRYSKDTAHYYSPYHKSSYLLNFYKQGKIFPQLNDTMWFIVKSCENILKILYGIYKTPNIAEILENLSKQISHMSV